MSAPTGVTPYGPELEEFTQITADKLVKRVAFKTDSTKETVGSFLNPDELAESICFETPSGDEKTIDYAKLSRTVDFLMKHATNTEHPMFFNQLFAAPDPLSIIGDWLGATLHTTMATYEMSGPFIMMEQAIMKLLRKHVGAGWENGDGLLCPGGSACNQMGVILARHDRFPELKQKGLASVGRLVLFTSAESHYSIDKAAFSQGFGTDNCVKVPCDASGCMDAKELRRLVVQTIEEGGKPFFVNATAGTTVRGAFDPFQEISEVAKEFNMWMHVDGAWGGPCFTSTKYAHMTKGIELADSITIDGHKMWGQTLQIAFILVKTEGKLLAANSANAKYLFQPDKPLAEYDTGDKTIQCGRRNDILKMWLNWQAIGEKGMIARVDTVLDSSRRFAELLREREGFVLIQEPQAPNVCFYYIPASLRQHVIAQRLFKGESAYELLRSVEAAEFCKLIGKVAPFIKKQTVKNGTFMCGFQAVCNLPNFWRMIFANPNINEDNMRTVMDVISKAGEDWSLDGLQVSAVAPKTH
eukprot:m.59331 g.59331  ORF g.59331 m.59331 type:complete len:527 (-) comp22690_c1_seq1:155-1735(-)